MLHEQIESNKRKTIVIFVSFVLFVLFVGAAITLILYDDYKTGILFSFIFCIIYVPIVLSSSDKIIMKMNHAKEIKSKKDNIFLWSTIENLAMVARIPMPKVCIINDSSPNAFAMGMSPKKAAVAVTTGLLERLNKEEVEGVVAHEIAHIRNYDVRLATISLALVSIVAIMSDLATRWLFYGGRSSKRNLPPYVYIIALILIILSPLVAMLIQLTVSRNREYLADASGAELCRNPRALAKALHKISKVSEPVEEASKATATMYISDPFKKKTRNLFSTHPPTEDRIKRLLKM